MSKLMYSFAGAERRRLDGRQTRCLRETRGIKPTFLSRATNKTVLETTRECSLSSGLLQQQLLLFGKCSRLGDASVMRLGTFRPGSLGPATHQFARKMGIQRLAVGVAIVRASQQKDSECKQIAGFTELTICMEASCASMLYIATCF